MEFSQEVAPKRAQMALVVTEFAEDGREDAQTSAQVAEGITKDFLEAAHALVVLEVGKLAFAKR